MDEYERGTTVRFVAAFTDITNTASNASGVWAYISDPNDTKTGSTNAATASGTGIYFYEYTLPSTGSLGYWQVEWTGSVNNLPTVKRQVIRVIETRQI